MNMKSFQTRNKTDDSIATFNSILTEVRHFFKVILLGNTAVGKTSIFSKVLEKKFDKDYKCTLSVDFKMKSMLIDHNTWVEMQVWDTCGQEMYRSLTRQYYNGTQG